MAKFDKLAAREDTDVMPGREEVDVWAKLHAVANDDQAGVEGSEAGSLLATKACHLNG